MRIPLMVAVVLSLVLPHPVAAQTQITTGVIQGRSTDATGASLPGVTVEARNLDTNLARTSVTDARRPVRVPAAAARATTGDVHARGLRHASCRRTSS